MAGCDNSATLAPLSSHEDKWRPARRHGHSRCRLSSYKLLSTPLSKTLRHLFHQGPTHMTRLQSCAARKQLVRVASFREPTNTYNYASQARTYMSAAPMALYYASRCRSTLTALCVCCATARTVNSNRRFRQQPSGYRLVATQQMPGDKPVDEIALVPTVSKILVLSGASRRQICSQLLPLARRWKALVSGVPWDGARPSGPYFTHSPGVIVRRRRRSVRRSSAIRSLLHHEDDWRFAIHTARTPDTRKGGTYPLSSPCQAHRATRLHLRC